MSSDIDELIRTEVERSFEAEPPLRDPRAYAVRGRRARRRRQATGAVAVVTAALVAAVVAHSVQPSAAPGRGVEPAGATDAVVPVLVTTPLPVDPRTAEECAAGSLGSCDSTIGWDDVHLDTSGALVRGSADVQVTGHYEHVLPDAYRISDALEITVGERTVWALLWASDPTDSTTFHTARPDPDRTFDQWVRDSAAAGRWFSYDEAQSR